MDQCEQIYEVAFFQSHEWARLAASTSVCATSPHTYASVRALTNASIPDSTLLRKECARSVLTYRAPHPNASAVRACRSTRARPDKRRETFRFFERFYALTQMIERSQYPFGIQAAAHYHFAFQSVAGDESRRHPLGGRLRFPSSEKPGQDWRERSSRRL